MDRESTPDWVVPGIIRGAIVLLACLLFVLLLLVIGAPVVNRAVSLFEYVSRPEGSTPNLNSELFAEVRSRLTNGQSSEFATRLVIQEVPAWKPVDMDQAAARLERIREVADTVPGSGPSWQEMHGGIRDSYLLFLTALSDYSRKRGALLAKTEQDLAAISRARGRAMAEVLVDHQLNTERMDSSESAISRLRTRLAGFQLWPTPVPDQRLLGVAVNDAFLTLTPNPADQFSAFPTLSSPTEFDLSRWFDTDGGGRKAITSVRLTVPDSPQILAPTTPASSPAVDSEKVTPLSGIAATLFAKDWEIFRLRRPWMNEALLERYHRDSSPLLNMSWLFEDTGPLAKLPFALIIARDVTYRVAFDSESDFLAVKQALGTMKPLRLTVGKSSILLEPGATKLQESDRSLLIAPTKSHAQVVGIVSIRY